MKLVVKNPWSSSGSAYEPQRADMWVVDCHAVYDKVVAVYAGYADRFSDSELTSVSARNVVFPIQKVGTQTVIRGNIPVVQPGYDEALENTRITFVQNAGNETAPQAAKVYNLLYLWRQLARQGRDEINGFDFNTKLLTSNQLIPDYRCDIDVVLISDYDTSLDDDGGVAGHASLRSTFRLKNAWISGLQLDSLDYDGSKLLMATADIPAEDIIPL